MKHIIVDLLSGETLKELNRFPLTDIPSILIFNNIEYMFVSSEKYIDEKKEEYILMLVNKIIRYDPGVYSLVPKPFAEHKTIDRLKTSPDGKSQIFTDADGKVFHRTKVSELKWSSWTRYV